MEKFGLVMENWKYEFFFFNNWNCSEITNQKIAIHLIKKEERKKKKEKFWKRMETIYKEEGMFNNDSCAWSTIYNPQEEKEYNFSKLRTSHERDFGTLVGIFSLVSCLHRKWRDNSFREILLEIWKSLRLVILMKSL